MRAARFGAVLTLACVLSWAPALRAEGPFGGSVTAVVLQPDGDTPAWASTSRGLFRFDRGRWAPVPALGLRSLVSVAETGGRLVVAEENQGLWASDDRGESWAPSNVGLKSRYGHPATDVRCLEADPRKPGRLYAGTVGKGAFQSVDGGATWELLAAGLEDEPAQAHHATALLPPRGSRPLLLGTDGRGLYAWTNGKWGALGRGLPAGLRVRLLVEAPDDERRLALAARGQGLWESRDGGASWSLVEKGVYGSVDGVALGPQGRGAAHFWAEGVALWGGAPLARTDELASADVLALVALRSGGWLAAPAHDGLAALSPDGRVTGYPVQGLDGTSVLALAVGPDGKELWAGDTNGVFSSRDGGVTWQPRDQGLAPAGASRFLVVGGDLYLGTLGQGVYRWRPELLQWEARSGGLGTANTLYGFAADGAGRLYAGTEGGVLRALDGGKSWTRATRGLAAAPAWLVAAVSVGGRAWAAGGGKVYQSVDGGENWRFLADANPVALAVRSTPGGEELWWVEPDRVVRLLPSGAASVAARAEGELRLSGIAFSADGVWVATHRGVSRLTPEGLRPVWEGAPARSLLPLASGELLVGTDGRGVARLRAP